MESNKITIANCSQCDCGEKRIIVNKHFFLCEKKNTARLNDKKPHREKPDYRNSGKKPISRNKPIQVRVKSKRSIAHVSSKTRYTTSWGEVVSQEEVNRRYAETCLKIDQERERFCEGTGRTDLPLSHSHTISRARCKQLGKIELVWDKDNLFLESMGASDSGHYIWENGSLEDKIKLHNFEKKLEYIALHDQEQYNKFLMGIEELTAKYESVRTND